MRKSIETKIRLNAIFIYLLVALVCGGVFFYFYTDWKKISTKKKSIEEYNEQLSQISELIYSVNQAQAEVNLFIITEKKKHLKLFQEQAKEIGNRIDSLKTSQYNFGVDTILTEITELLKRKERSIILLNKQFTHVNPIDSLSRELTDLSSSIQKEQPDSLQTIIIESSKPATKRGFWKRLGNVFSSDKGNNKADTTIISVPVATDTVAPKDTIQFNRIIRQARVNYQQQMAAIESQINSVVLADQYITSRITELLIQLYNKIVQARMEELNEDEELLRKNNIHALIVGGVALLLILVFIILILHYVNKGYMARKALEEANERTRQLMESRHKLLLSVSHDVKTPLNSMLGYIELYHQQGLLTAGEIAPINSSGNHILALLNNLLEYSSIEKGSVALIHRNFSPYELCIELCDMFAPLARKKSLTFNCKNHFDTKLIVCSDCLRAKQILVNILSNAIKYTAKGSVTLEADYKNNKLEFHISDTGIGIAADKQKDLFKPFSRIEENNTLDEGHGFGLFVVKGLIELFKGDIEFHSEPQMGTQVTIRIPVQEASSTEIDQSPRQILLVDDDNVFLDMLAGLCKRLGHKVTTCKNSHEFNHKLPHLHTYDCILTDMEMENFTGKEVLNKTREVNKRIPVILITGRQDYLPAQLLAEGFTDYLLKPITLNGLHSLIGGKLDKKQANNLSGLLGENDKEVREMMELFIMTTINHLVSLKEAIKEEDFRQAQHLCHKMLPMFLQIEAPTDITQVLKYVDSQREEKQANKQIWRLMEVMIPQIEEFLSDIQEKYLTDAEENEEPL